MTAVATPTTGLHGDVGPAEGGPAEGGGDDRAGLGPVDAGLRSRVAVVLTPDRLLTAAVLAGSLTVGLWNVTDAVAFQDDEGTYAAQAAAAAQGTLGPYTYWYDHPPFGWFQIAALAALPRALGIGDGSELAVTRVVAGTLFAVTATLVHLVLRRLGVAAVISVAATALLVASPLALTLGRQVFLDNVATPWVLLAFWLALSPRRALWAHVGAGAAFGVALLTKLTIAVVGPALLVALLAGRRWRNRGFSLTGALTAGALVLALFPLMALLRSELLAGPDRVSLQQGLEFQLGSRTTSGSFWDVSSGRHALVLGWVDQSQVLVVVGLIGALLCLLDARTRWVPVALAGFAAPMLLGLGYLPGMNVVGALSFLAVAAGAGAHRVWRALAVGLDGVSGRPRRVVTTTIAVLAVTAVGAAAAPEWRERSLPLATADANADWRDAVAWIGANVPDDDVVVVPFSAWSAVQDQGRGGPWTVVALEKVDLDSQFDVEHAQGWREIEWILVGPTTEPNIVNLGLTEMARAMDGSTEVVAFGEWSVREVDTGDTTDTTDTTDRTEEQP
ncbi:ArnT family glycosyltransferase [Serinibacter arcticus]|uniref:Dolichyl-phosphate-mannose-protein mannosyltransferase family n=1 Tax=Serinibacter arcticus TaxID=1655435 RepID=A0A4Z1DZU3_9MICO|nr:glycosyltransferase family 39 protein [Serinibacter arcticus]TGO05215.1 Dolichyl-phosphate-mannose-protein mannosyltransferase family [Serinibacter arcticus]